MALFCSRPGHRSKAAPVYSSSDSEEDYDKDMAWAYESLKMKQGLRNTSVFHLDMIFGHMTTFQAVIEDIRSSIDYETCHMGPRYFMLC